MIQHLCKSGVVGLEGDAAIKFAATPRNKNRAADVALFLFCLKMMGLFRCFLQMPSLFDRAECLEFGKVPP